MTRDFPDFLIIGAMKAGTTSLARDLGRHPDVFIPEDKEPETLVRFSDPDRIRADYRGLFPRAAAGKVKGDASTAYAKRPTHEGVAERAHAMSNGRLRIVYIRREPVARIVSHYKHEVQHKVFRVAIGEALRAHPELIDYSRYAWQAEPWIRLFGREAVLEIDLEDFAAQRHLTLRKVAAHIGVDPQRMAEPELDQVSNSAQEMKAIESRAIDRLVQSDFYRRKVKPLIPRGWRETAKRMVAGRAEPVDATLSDDDLAFIRSSLARERA